MNTFRRPPHAHTPGRRTLTVCASTTRAAMHFDARPETDRLFREMVQAGLDLFDPGLTVFDHELRMVAWKPVVLRLLDFPESLAVAGMPFEAFIRYNAERGEYGPGDIDAISGRARARRAQLSRPLHRAPTPTAGCWPYAARPCASGLYHPCTPTSPNKTLSRAGAAAKRRAGRPCARTHQRAGNRLHPADPGHGRQCRKSPVRSSAARRGCGDHRHHSGAHCLF